MSGVKNLRAMFEQKNTDTSPPDDRGRSPGPGLPSFGSPTPSSRPLSKVRTNFIAVEKDGRMGLQRQNSGDSASASSRRLSNETESTTPAPASEKNDVFTDNMATNVASFKTNLASETIPESPRQASPAKLSPTRGSSQTPDITPCPNPDKIVDEEESKTKLTPADPTVKANVNGTSNGLNGTAEHKEKPKNTTSAGKPALKPAAPITTSAKTASKTTKSPLAAKSPKSPAKETAKAPEKKPAPAGSKDSTPKTATTKPVTSSGKKPGALDLSPTGFVKPKPKSPTRPVNLPSRLTAPTTASASKLGGSAPAPRQSLSRASGNLGVPATSHRPTSRASATTATNATAASTGKTLKRQASTIGRARPSLGPPPKLPAKDHPPTRKEAAHVDEGFLARMMRPTQASSSKTLDKAPVTPPRKQTGPAATRKTPSKDVESSAKKLAAKVTEPVKKESTVKKPVVAKTEVKKVAPAAASKSAQPTAKEVAPVVAQVATADAAVEAAKTSKDTAVAPAVEKQAAEPAEAVTTTPPGTPPKAQPESADKPDTETSLPTEVAKAESEDPVVAKEPETVVDEQSTNHDSVPSSTEEIAPQSNEEPKNEAPADVEAVTTSSSDEPKVEQAVDVDETVPSSSEEPKIEETTDTKDSEVVPEEKKVASTDEHSVPAVDADPEKVEDIEDVVQESTEQPVEKSD